MKHKREFRLIDWAIFLGTAAILVLGSLYFDHAARVWMTEHQSPGLRSFMRIVSTYGDWPEHIALGLVLCGIAYWRGSKRWVRILAAMIVACALAGVSARVVKIATGRARPNVHAEAGWNGPRFSARYNAFPSGHTAASTAFFATLAFVSWRIGIGFLAIPILIAFSRMYVAAHYLSDVVAAALIGVVAAFCVVRWKPLSLGNAEPTDPRNPGDPLP